ncbi:amino acid adenylation domain-containing protein [Laspinema sp. D1]|uniref:non-ribosomal peptide synthetase n=1 Tax=Laspinema palackyanum TaxID=3231601 RepID=UPI0034828B05|nr:amino acid adenylation domain-containing protein [Laspinema sp. D2b]
MESNLFNSPLTPAPDALNLSPETDVFVFPTSFAQQRLWFIDQFAPGHSFYNVTTALRLTGVVNFPALADTFIEIGRRHETLRTRFTTVEGEPVQVISPEADIPVNWVDLRQFSSGEREAEATRWAAVEAEFPFNLATGPLLRVTLLQMEDSLSILLLNMHHIISDDWSMGVFVQELGTIYRALVENRPVLLPELPLQYADFAEWQREWFQGEVLEEQLGYWRQQLRGIVPLNLPGDSPKPATPSYQGKSQVFELSQPLTAALKALSQQEGVTLFMTLLAGFQTLLYRYSQQDEITVGSPIANRNRSEIEGLIGFFVNSLVLRTDVSGNPTFRELLARVREVTLGAYGHQDLPFEKVVEALHPDRVLNVHPLFQVVFNLQNAPMQELDLPGLTVSSMSLGVKTTRFDLEVHLWESADSFRSVYGQDWQHQDSLRGFVIYNTDKFESGTVAQMLEQFKTLLKKIVKNPNQRVEELELISDGERDRILIEWNQTQAEYPAETAIQALFEAQVQANPQAVAVTIAGESLTYQQLNQRSNQLAHYLQHLGVGDEEIVGLCAAKSLDTIVGMLGILKAGGAYLPLDPTYPSDRLNWMMADAGVRLLLVPDELRGKFNGFEGVMVGGDCDGEAVTREPVENLPHFPGGSRLAYVIYTSGSTGTPKGVAVPHQAVNRLVLNTNYIQITPKDTVAQVSNLSFDAATFEIWGALLNGAHLKGISTEVTLSPHDFARELRQQQIDILFLTTALFQQVVRTVPQAFQSLRCLLFGGETVDPRWVKKVLNQGMPQQLIHVYGPTENTTFSTYFPIEAMAEPASSVPIGKAVANTELYLLDPHLQPVAVGVPGELYLGGEGLARGYLNRPDLTEERFISNPFGKPGTRLYKTGDLARYKSDGNLEFLGRIDHQVKIRGFRIELGEIEAVLCQYPGVAAAVAIAREEIPGEKELVAYVVPQDPEGKSSPLKISELRRFLSEKLPSYMLPTAYAILEVLPLTPNGKINRQILPKIETAFQELSQNYVNPRTEVEKVLVDIWREVLGKQQVSVYDNFFELGGHSLLATQLISRIRDGLKIELPVSQLFEAPTVASLANYIETVCWAAQPQKLSKSYQNEREEVEF